jgi:hypothetical protein
LETLILKERRQFLKSKVSLPHLSMKKAKILSILTAVALFFGAASAMATPVMAENSYEPVTGTTVNFVNYLKFKGVANAPTSTFTFTITSNDVTPLDPASGKEAVFAGNNAAVSGSPTIESSSFSSSSQEYDSAQAIGTDAIGQHANIANDPITLGANEVYARDLVQVDFTGVTFAEPGVYRWKITEQADSTLAGLGIVMDSNPVRYLDVYVSHDTFTPDNSTQGAGEGTLEITGYVLHSVADFQPSDNSTPTEPTQDEASTKAIGYVNTFETHDVALSNSVSGNQASIDKYFKYTVAITNAGDTNRLEVVGAHDATVTTATANSVTDTNYKGQTNVDYITTDAQGAVTQDFYLQHGQNLTVQGLPKNANMTITVTPEDYTPSYSLDSATAVNSASVQMNTIVADHSVAFTNNKAGTIPTGIIVSVVPGAMLVLGAGFAAMRVLKNRQED